MGSIITIHLYILISHSHMKIKTTQQEQRLFRACNSKEVNHHHLYLRDSKAGREMRALQWKKKGFRYIQTGSCWHREVEGRLTESQAPYVSGLGSLFGFFWLVLSWKQGQNIGKLQLLTKS